MTYAIFDPEGELAVAARDEMEVWHMLWMVSSFCGHRKEYIKAQLAEGYTCRNVEVVERDVPTAEERVKELEAQLADLTRHYNEALRDIEKRQSDNSLMLKSLIGYSRLCDDAGIDYSSDKLLAAYEKAIADKTVTGGE